MGIPATGGESGGLLSDRPELVVKAIEKKLPKRKHGMVLQDFQKTLMRKPRSPEVALCWRLHGRLLSLAALLRGVRPRPEFPRASDAVAKTCIQA